jgi:hypothetical protein
LREAAARAAIYVGMACGGPDERVFTAVRSLRLAPLGARLTLAQFKTMVREQYFMLLIDPEATLAAIPKMLPTNAEERRDGFTAIRQILAASGDISGEAAERLSRVARLFGLEEEASALPFRRPEDELRAKAS